MAILAHIFCTLIDCLVLTIMVIWALILRDDKTLHKIKDATEESHLEDFYTHMGLNMVISVMYVLFMVVGGPISYSFLYHINYKSTSQNQASGLNLDEEFLLGSPYNMSEVSRVIEQAREEQLRNEINN